MQFLEQETDNFIKCPICGGKCSYVSHGGYDEPPENITYCVKCGYTEYYFYYDGDSTYVESYMFNEEKQQYESKRICSVHGGKDPKELKKMLLKELEKMDMTLEDLIQLRKDCSEFRRKKYAKEEKEKLETEARWKRGDLNQGELLTIHKFLTKEITKLENLKSKGIITQIEIEDNFEGLIEEVTFTIDQKKCDEYVGEKQLAQIEFAKKNETPLFASTSCYNCHTEIYNLTQSTKTLFGKEFAVICEPLTLERCSTSLITGCPRCNKSYVD